MVSGSEEAIGDGYADDASMAEIRKEADLRREEGHSREGEGSERVGGIGLRSRGVAPLSPHRRGRRGGRAGARPCCGLRPRKRRGATGAGGIGLDG